MRTMIAIPCMDSICTPTVISLTGLQVTGEAKFAYSVSSLVYDSRNSLARQAIMEGFDQVLWLDSDMTFDPDLLVRLESDLGEDKEMVSALYVTRKGKIKPVVYDKCGYDHVSGTVEVIPYAHSYYDYPKDSLFECEAVGFGGVLMKTSLLKEVTNKYGLPFSPIMGFGEDLSFCMRVRDMGKKIYCDSRVKMGHIGHHEFTEEDYRP